MSVPELLKQQNMTRYRLSKLSGVPNATLNDICSGKARIEKCSAETIYRIAKVFHVPMETLIEESINGEEAVRYAPSFELYKSHICHRVKDNGDIPFIIETLKSGEVRKLYEQKRYREALYLLAMVDYLSRENDLPLCAEYRDIRSHKLNKTVYPNSILALAIATGDESVKEKSYRDAIPEFKRFNIVENEVRNVLGSQPDNSQDDDKNLEI